MNRSRSIAPRPTPLLAAIVALVAPSVHAQDWSEYFSSDDFFSIEFPGEPMIAEGTYETEFGIELPASVYTAEDDFGSYSLTAVDWRDAESLHEARYEACLASLDGSGDSGPGSGCIADQSQDEISGSMLHAMSNFLERGSKVTFLGQMDSEEIEGLRVHLSNDDGSRTYGAAHWHENRLYVIEATAPQGAPPPNAFPISIGFIDEAGRRVRYEERYSPLLPIPARSR